MVRAAEGSIGRDQFGAVIRRSVVRVHPLPLAKHSVSLFGGVTVSIGVLRYSMRFGGFGWLRYQPKKMITAKDNNIIQFPGSRGFVEPMAMAA